MFAGRLRWKHGMCIRTPNWVCRCWISWDNLETSRTQRALLTHQFHYQNPWDTWRIIGRPREFGILFAHEVQLSEKHSDKEFDLNKRPLCITVHWAHGAKMSKDVLSALQAVDWGAAPHVSEANGCTFHMSIPKSSYHSRLCGSRIEPALKGTLPIQ